LTANRKIAGRDLPVTLVKVDEQYMLFPPWSSVFTNTDTASRAISSFAWGMRPWELIAITVQKNYVLETEKKCFIPNKYSVIQLWENTKNKDLVFYQGFLQAYWLTKFIDTDSYKWDNGLKRYEAAKMFVEFAKKVLCREEREVYKDWMYNDIDDVDITLVPYIKDAYELWILNGTNGAFRPLDNITKKEFVAALMRMLFDQNLDVPWAWEDRDSNYQVKFAELWIERNFNVGSTIERYDVARMLYKIYYQKNYTRTENWYVLPE
jgi:hypothetical protein